MKLEQGHHIAIIQHGKGDKRRVVKLKMEVFRAIEDYIKITNRKNDAPGAALFMGCTKGGQSTTQASATN